MIRFVPSFSSGLEILTSGTRFHLALIDINMPRMTGIEMVEALHEHYLKAPKSDGAAPKLVMLTAESRLELVTRAKKVGVCGWIIKPSTEELVVKLARSATGFGKSEI